MQQNHNARILRVTRLFGTVHVIVFAAGLALAAAGAVQPDLSSDFNKGFAAFAAAAFAAAVIDMLAVAYLARRARWFIGTGQFGTAFYGGMSWSFLYGAMGDIAGAPRRMRRLLRNFGAPEDRAQVESLLAANDLQGALVLFQKIVTRLMNRERLMERKEERAKRRASELGELVAEGRALGIPEREFADQSPALCRGRIKRARDEQQLLTRAGREGIETMIARVLAAQGYEAARYALAGAIAIRERADCLGITAGERVRALLGSDQLAEAERYLAEAERAKAFSAKRVELEERISRLPPDRRTIAHGKLATLDPQAFGTREGRKALHQIEEIIGARA